MDLSKKIEIDTSEIQLVERLKNGDTDSFEYLVREYGGYMLAIAKRYLNSDADIQDSVQDAYMRAFQAIHNFEGRSSLKSWLHRITVNSALMKLRTNGRRPIELIEDNPSLFDSNGKRIETDSEITLSVEDIAIDKSKQWLVKSKIDLLPTTSRNLLLLRDIEGYSTEETSELLNISIAAVKTGLHRARQTLKKNLENEYY